MKARKQLDKETKRQALLFAKGYAAEIVEREEVALTRRIMKIMLVAARQEFGFGEERLARLTMAMTELAKKRNDEPETFYSHIDKVLIDEMGLPLDREDLNADE